MQASVSECIRDDKHCVVISINVRVVLQLIHNCKVSFTPKKYFDFMNFIIIFLHNYR